MDLLLIISLAVIGCGGYKIALNVLSAFDSDHAKAMGLPIGILVLMLLARLAVPFISFQACMLTGIILLGAAAVFLPKAETGYTAPPFSYGQKLLIMSVILICVFYVHTDQLTHVSSDFWFSYPLSRSIIKSSEAAHPFFPWIKLNSYPYQASLISLLSSTINFDTLRTQWILEFALIINSILLWAFTVRKVSDNASAGAFAVLFAFLGINVGGKAGLMDAYDNGDLLIFLFLALILGLFSDIVQKAKEHWPISKKQIVCTALFAGIYGNICETYLWIVLACFVSGSLIVIKNRRSAAKSLLKLNCLCITLTLIISALLGSPSYAFANKQIKDKVKFLLFRQPSQILSADAGQENELPIQIKFPKKPFLSIRLGIDPYQRFSSAFNNALFRHYRPLLDDGGYSFIFGYKVLLMHWIPTWIAPLTLLWAGYKHNTCGYMLGLFGCAAYIIPAVIDFGPIQEAQYFRWEFAAGLGFAVLASLFVSDLWERLMRMDKGAKKNACTALITCFVLCNLAGAQKTLNSLVISAQCDTAAAASTLFPWYPETEKWLLKNSELKLNKRDLHMADWLWNCAGDKRRVMFVHPIGQDSLLKCAAVNGLSGTLSYDHAYNPSWRPLGSTPSLPNESCLTWQASSDISILSGSGADWLITQSPIPDLQSQNARWKGRFQVNLKQTFGNTLKYFVYKIDRISSAEKLDRSKVLKSQIQIKDFRISKISPAPGSISKACVKTSEPLCGWLKIFFTGSKYAPAVTLPVTQYVSGDKFKVYLCAPLSEGSFTVSCFYSKDGSSWEKLQGCIPISYSMSKYIEDSLRVENISFISPSQGTITLKNISSETFDCGEPIYIKGLVWSEKLHNYRTFSEPESMCRLDKAIKPKSSVSLIWKLKEPAQEGQRIDISVSSAAGQNIIVPRL